MKKIYILIASFFSFYFIQAQNGLERVIVEKYYISDANDALNDDGGVVPEGAVTYRVFVDMLPNYTLRAIYGNTFQGTDHFLKIATTTAFFNNNDRGSDTPSFTRNRLDDNTVMLDTWLSVGGACSTCIGVLKDVDDGVNTIENGDGILQNDDEEAGIPIKEQDGLIEGEPEPVTIIGLDTELFDTEISTESLNVNGGSWAALDGAVGPDAETNIVLIGQFTTDGEFSFELNIQLRNEETLEAENFVARDPINDGVTVEYSIPSLIYPDTTVTSTTEIELAAEIESDLRVFPNPFMDKINLDLTFNSGNKISSFEVYSIQGALVKSGLVNSDNTEIDFVDLPDGLYIAKILIGNKVVSKKIFKESSK